jgi:chromosome segregation protein
VQYKKKVYSVLKVGARVVLQRLELYGFKSFASKCMLEFGPGITAVVGPNGSGKSNVADAFRWVLGEQRIRLLRGETMEDMIFAGSDKRRSLGYAEVILVLDNTTGVFPVGYTEIEVSRRLYRSGESEFRINNVQCRLRDIQELFMDTGVGKDNYSLISQGQVENLLLMRPEERRTLLEEVAGILKYRHRKREVLRKLEEVQKNQLRLCDLLAELSKQLPQLKNEAEKEKLYRQYKKELEACQISLAIYELERLRGVKKSQEEKLKEKQAAFHMMKSDFEETMEKIKEQKNMLNVLTERLEKETEALSFLHARIGRLEESITHQEKRSKSINIDINKKQSQLVFFFEKLKEAEQEEGDTEIYFRQTQENLLQTRQELELAEGTLLHFRALIKKGERELETDKDEALEIIRRQTELKNSVFIAQTQRDSSSLVCTKACSSNSQIVRFISSCSHCRATIISCDLFASLVIISHCPSNCTILNSACLASSDASSIRLSLHDNSRLIS